MQIVWYVNDNVEAPEPVECDKTGYPNKDAKGRVQYVNSHYATEAEAWGRLLANGNAHLEVAQAALEEAKRQLERRATDVAEARARRTSIGNGYAAFRRRIDLDNHEPSAQAAGGGETE